MILDQQSQQIIVTMFLYKLDQGTLTTGHILLPGLEEGPIVTRKIAKSGNLTQHNMSRETKNEQDTWYQDHPKDCDQLF